MELRKFIYDLRYSPTFVWIDKKSAILELIKQSKRFDGLGFAVDRIDARQEKENSFKTLTLELNKLSGLVEEKDLDIDRIKDNLSLPKQILDGINLNKDTVTRIGVRFHFIKEMSFKDANDFFIDTMSPEFKKILGGAEFIDSAIVPVVRYDGHSIKYMLGPLRRIEYPRYFNQSSLIKYDEGCLFDIDCYSSDYHSLRLDKFAEDAFNSLKKIVDDLEGKIEEYVTKTKRR